MLVLETSTLTENSQLRTLFDGDFSTRVKCSPWSPDCSVSTIHRHSDIRKLSSSWLREDWFICGRFSGYMSFAKQPFLKCYCVSSKIKISICSKCNLCTLSNSKMCSKSQVCPKVVYVLLAVWCFCCFWWGSVDRNTRLTFNQIELARSYRDGIKIVVPSYWVRGVRGEVTYFCDIC